MRLGRKGVFPINRWYAGLILMFTLYITYGVTSEVVEIRVQNIEFVKNNFVIGVVVLFGGIMFFMVLSGVPFQREDVVR
jgi:hypothetical protein